MNSLYVWLNKSGINLTMGVCIFQFKAYLQYCYPIFPTGKRSLFLDGSYVLLSVFNSVSALKEYMYLSSFDSITFIYWSRLCNVEQSVILGLSLASSALCVTLNMSPKISISDYTLRARTEYFLSYEVKSYPVSLIQ